MKKLILLVLAYTSIHMDLINAQESSAEPIVFTVNTLRMNVDNDSAVPLSDARLSEIKPIGRGSPSDLDCEGISNDQGKMLCVVNNCNKSSPLSNTYHIGIQAPNEFGEMKPAQVKVFQCDVIPTPASAIFIEKTLIALKFRSDVQSVFGENTIAVLNGQASVTVEEYTGKMSTLLKKPAGSTSAIKMRKIFLNNSMDAVKSNESTKANDYSGLAIAHANVWINEWAQQNGVNNLQTNNLNQMATLNKNIGNLLEEKNDNKSVLVYEEQLKFLKESIEKGEFANEQFKALESISIK